METFLQKVQRVGLKASFAHLIFKIREKKAYFFIWMSRKVLKQEGGLDLHVWGKLKYAFIKMFGSVPTENKHEDVVGFLRENQYAKVPLNLPPETVRMIQEKINRFIEDEEFSYPRGKQSKSEKKHYSRAMKKIALNVPEIKQVITPELDAIIKEYYGTNYGITSVLCWRNYHVPNTADNKVLYSNDWHNDYIEPMELKMFVNMSDVTEKDGPLHVISYPTTVSLVNRGVYHGRFGKNKTHDIEVSNDLIKHTGPAGSAVFCHTSSCLHRADIPAEGHYRDMLEFQFHPAITPLREDWENGDLMYA